MIYQYDFFHLFLLQLACRIMSIATHYFLSASFCWMLAEGIHIYNKIVRVFSNKKYNKVFFVLGWGKCNSKITWPASMQIYWNKTKRLHQKRVQLPQDWFGTPTWPSFYCFGTSIWPPWKHSLTLKPLLFGLNVWLLVSNFEEQFPIPTVGQLSGDRWPTFGRQSVLSSCSLNWTSEWLVKLFHLSGFAPKPI